MDNLNLNYEIRLYFEEAVWVAEAPELPGCATHADTRKEAFELITSLIPEWIKIAKESNIDIPKPKRQLALQ